MFQYCVTSDFADELHRAPFDRAMLRAMMRIYRDWGVSRIYWMDYRDYSLFGSLSGQAHHNILTTQKNLGNILAAAVEAGHAEGIEIYAIIKPFEGGMVLPLPVPAPLPADEDELSALNRVAMRCASFVRARPRQRMKHRLADTAPTRLERPIARLVFESADTATPTIQADAFHLFTSPDNRGYRPYAAPFSFSLERLTPTANGAVWRLTVDGLDIPEPYLLIVAPTVGSSFRNYWHRIARAYDADGNLVITTPGWDLGPAPTVDRMSVIFNYLGNTGDGFWGQRIAREALFPLANGECFLGLAVGVEPYVSGALCPAEPGARAAWLEWTRECLDAGVDGIDFRIKNHCMPIEWEDYGYNDPVIAEYQCRHGVDIRLEPADPDRKAAILGDAYTAFLRDASRMIRAAGRRVQHHLSEEMFAEPGHWHNLGIQWQWRTWFDEGLLDAVTLKNSHVLPRERVRSVGGAEAARRGIPFFYCPWHSTAGSQPVQYEIIRREAARAVGDPEAAGFTLYESDAVLNISAGRVEARTPCLWPVPRHSAAPQAS